MTLSSFLLTDVPTFFFTPSKTQKKRLNASEHWTSIWIRSLFVTSLPFVVTFRYSVEVPTTIVLSPWRSNYSDDSRLFSVYHVMMTGDQEQIAAKSRDMPGKINQLWVNKRAHTQDHFNSQKHTGYFPQGASEIEQFLNSQNRTQ